MVIYNGRKSTFSLNTSNIAIYYGFVSKPQKVQKSPANIIHLP